jgi:hypothetical protein
LTMHCFRFYRADLDGLSHLRLGLWSWAFGL